MDNQKARRFDMAEARRTIAELREELNQTQTYMMAKTDEYAASLERYRMELALCRETIRRLVVAFRVVWLWVPKRSFSIVRAIVRNQFKKEG